MPNIPTPEPTSPSPTLEPTPSNTKQVYTWIIIAVLVTSIIFGAVGYLLGNFGKSGVNTLSNIVDQNIPSVDNSSFLLETEVDPIINGTKNDQKPNELPSGWRYLDTGRCGVKLPLPPKSSPYYSARASDYIDTSETETGSGRFWNFSNELWYPNIISKLPNFSGETAEMQAAAQFFNPEVFSEFISQVVLVSCMKNDEQIVDNKELMFKLTEGISEYNGITDYKGAQASTYVIKENIPNKRWGKDVVDLIVTEDNDDANYTVFVTPEYIYEVRIMGATEDRFVKETAAKIFENLFIQP